MALPLGFTPLEARTYLILVVCWVSIAVVNLLEQPYARSLVQCDVPVNTTEGAESSLSQHCGSRLHVIGDGAEISGKGQSLENVGRILITLFVSGFADYGRKRAAMLGQFLITLSTVLFALAQFLPVGLGIPTYIVAQGLQGMSGIGILDQIVTGDVALEVGDSVAVYGRKQLFTTLMFVSMIPVVSYVQYAEITDFTYVWTGIVILNLGALLLLYLFFPETLHKDKMPEKMPDFSVIGIAKDELKNFRKLINTHAYVGPKLVEDLFSKLADAGCIGLPFLMARFHFSQFDALVFSWIPMVVGGILMGGVVPGLCAKHGTRNIWWRVTAYYRTTFVLFALMQPTRVLTFIPFPLVGSFLHLPLAGFGAVSQGVEIRLIKQENNAKYQAMNQMISFVCGATTSYLYSELFNAEATTFYQWVFPYMVSCVFMTISSVWYITKIQPLHLDECDRLDKENLEKYQAELKAAEKAKEANGDADKKKEEENGDEVSKKASEAKDESEEKEPEKEPEEKTEEQKKAD